MCGLDRAVAVGWVRAGGLAHTGVRICHIPSLLRVGRGRGISLLGVLARFRQTLRTWPGVPAAAWGLVLPAGAMILSLPRLAVRPGPGRGDRRLAAAHRGGPACAP